ncbi:uncharacterized protein LOC143027980 [Oratosquilla oratoria]|uniref:uncharacterized protein LOC143027980 n=1 Tax=Oratosquilla oratoria TaxID=337810 RepID=UPI003F7626E1
MEDSTASCHPHVHLKNRPTAPPETVLEHITAVSSPVPAARHLYVDGSLQLDSSAGCTVYSPDVEPPEGGWVGRRLPNSSSSTYCELQALLLAVNLLCQRRLNGVVMCDSQSALQAISSSQPIHRPLIHHILQHLVTAQEYSLTIRFMEIPSHVGIAANEKADFLDKNACKLSLPDDATPSPSATRRPYTLPLF